MSFNISHAEKINIHGLEFDYEIINQTDNDYIEVKSAGSEKLIKRKDLNNFLIRANLESKDKQYDYKSLAKFTEGVLESRNQFALEKVTSKIFNLRFIEIDQAFEYFEIFSEFWLEKLATLDQSKVDFELNKQHNAGKVFLFNTITYYSKDYLKQCCTRLNLSEVFASYIRRSYQQGKSYSEVKEKLTNFVKQELYEDEVVKAVDVLGHLELMRNGRGDFYTHYLQLKTNYSTYYSELTKLVNAYRIDQIRSLILRDQLHQALDLVILESAEERNEQTHELVLKVVEQIKSGYLKLLNLEPYSRYFLGMSQKDYRIKDRITEILDQNVRQLIKEGNLFEAREMLEVLSRYRPNPNRENTELIVALADKMYVNRLDSQATALLNNWPLELNSNNRITLFFSGYYLNFQLFFLCLALLLAIITYLYHYRYKSPIAKAVNRFINRSVDRIQRALKFNKPLEYYAEGELPPEEKPRFNEVRYRQLLNYFNLPYNLNQDQIKSVYRQRVKSYHPDLNPHQGEEEHNMFLEITKNYDELLELHKRKP